MVTLLTNCTYKPALGVEEQPFCLAKQHHLLQKKDIKLPRGLKDLIYDGIILLTGQEEYLLRFAQINNRENQQAIPPRNKETEDISL